MNKEEFIKDLEHWTKEEIINRAYDICCESIELQQENKQLNDILDKSLKNFNCEHKLRCEFQDIVDKAIEYLNAYWVSYCEQDEEWFEEVKNKTLKILKGDSNE